ncbi:MAG: hypothetical protein P8M34_09955 [Saprospiraceae bacterium]|nr:hypothetical protein [Saprospiraceae bacterium]
MAEKDTYKYLEEEFRKKASDQQYPYDPANWKELEKMLDDERRRTPIMWLKWGSLSLIFITLIGSGIYRSNASIKESSTTDEIGISENIQKEEYSQLNDEASIPKSSIYKDSQLPNKKSEIESNEETVEYQLETSSLNTSSLSNIVRNSNSINNIHFSQKGNHLLDNSFLIKENQSSQSPNLNAVNIDPGHNKKEALDDSEQEENLPVLSHILLTPLNSNQPKFSNPTLVDFGKLETFDYKKFSFVINVGLESSKTALGKRSPLNLNGGVQFNHAISKKITLVGGIRYVIDSYRAEKGEYKTVTKLFEQSGYPEYTLARCSMIDFQTGIGYHFNRVDGSGLSIQLSAVSNAMLDEEYDYMFSDSEKNWTGSWFGAHSTIFSALDISLNYRLPLSSNRFIELSPYAKIPTRGIGHGNIKLNTFGLKLGMTFGK